MYLIDGHLLQSKKDELKKYLLKVAPPFSLESKSKLEKLFSPPECGGEEGTSVIIRAVLTDLEELEKSNRRAQSELNKQKQDASSSSSSLFFEEIDKLLTVAFDCTFNRLCGKDICINMLNEVLMFSPILEVERAWSLFEKHSENLTKVLNSGDAPNKYLPILKITKELVNRLSTKQHGALIGRIMLKLADWLPLSEQSGVNQLGGRNEETFIVAENQKDFTGDGGGGSSRESASGYDFYKQFWDMQGFFTNKQHYFIINSAGKNNQNDSEKKKIPTLPMPPVLALSSQAEMLKYFQGLDKIVTELPKVPILADVTSATPQASSSRSVSYIPAGKLFQLQLSDPVFRRQVLTQALFSLKEVSNFLNHVEISKRKYLEEVRNKTMKRENWALLAKYDWIELDDPARPPIAQNVSKIRSQINMKKERVTNLLLSTPPDGEKYVKLITDLINEHETQWESWKDEGKCKSFELPALSMNTKHALVDPQAKAAEEALVYGDAVYQHRLNGLVNAFTYKASPAERTVMMESFEAHCKRMEEAIESEVRGPRDDFVYCWRGMRLAGLNQVALCKNLNGVFAEVVMKKMRPDEEEEEEDGFALESEEEFVFKEQEEIVVDDGSNSVTPSAVQSANTPIEAAAAAEEEEEEVDVETNKKQKLDEEEQEQVLETPRSKEQDDIDDEIMFKAGDELG